MAGTIATLLSTAQAIPKTGVGNRGQLRHAYEELKDLQAKHDPELASPYLAASANSVISPTLNASSGNLTITINFPKAGVAVTTGNIAFNASVATVQTAVDAALNGQVIGATYVADDVKVSGAGVLSGNAHTITANGTTVNNYNMVVTTSNVDLDAYEVTVTANVVGTGNRPAEAVLNAYGIVTPATVPTPQGNTPSTGDYVRGGNYSSVSPGLVDLLVREVEATEDNTIGDFIRTVVNV